MRLAWTENPNDPVAQQLKEEFGIRLRGLSAAVNRLQAADPSFAGSLDRVLGFELTEGLGANEEIGAAFKYLLDKSVHKLFHSEDYRTPKEVLALPGVEGVKIYILGPPKDVGAGAEPVKLADLLQRTVLYKVGHHGSRNATLSTKGLETMTSSELVAMIPVDSEWAHEKMHWEHPAKNVLERQEEKTRGRVIRSDKIPSGDDPPEKAGNATDREWDAFLAQLECDGRENPLWIQHAIPA